MRWKIMVLKLTYQTLVAFYNEYAPKIQAYDATLMPQVTKISDQYAIGAYVTLPEENDLALKLQDANLLPTQFIHEGNQLGVQIRYFSQPQRNDMRSCILCHEYGHRR